MNSFTKVLMHRCLCVPTGPMVMSGYSSHLWSCESQPQFWSKFQVWEWLQQVLDMHQIDATNFPFQNFDMEGHQLCNLSHQDFVRAAGSVGSILFQSVTELKWGGGFFICERGAELGAEILGAYLVQIKDRIKVLLCCC